MGGVPHVWQIVGTGNFDGDMQGRSDILWRHDSGLTYIWLMDGTDRIGQGSPGFLDPIWQVAGTGDFDGDQRADILWRHRGNGNTYIWFMNGTQFDGGWSIGNVLLTWEIAGTGTFDSGE